MNLGKALAMLHIHVSQSTSLSAQDEVKYLQKIFSLGL
jgi:hypothetical protein